MRELGINDSDKSSKKLSDLNLFEVVLGLGIIDRDVASLKGTYIRAREIGRVLCAPKQQDTLRIVLNHSFVRRSADECRHVRCTINNLPFANKANRGCEPVLPTAEFSVRLASNSNIRRGHLRK